MANDEILTKEPRIDDPPVTEGQGQEAIVIDPVLEKKIIRKFDYLVLPQFIIIILLAYLDRTNLGMLQTSPSLGGSLQSQLT